MQRVVSESCFQPCSVKKFWIWLGGGKDHWGMDLLEVVSFPEEFNVASSLSYLFKSRGYMGI